VLYWSTWRNWTKKVEKYYYEVTFNVLGVLFDPGETFRLDFFQVRVRQPGVIVDKLFFLFVDDRWEK
jgi:hypothetical protein